MNCLTFVRHIGAWNVGKKSNDHKKISILVSVLDCKFYPFFVSQ